MAERTKYDVAMLHVRRFMETLGRIRRGVPETQQDQQVISQMSPKHSPRKEMPIRRKYGHQWDAMMEWLEHGIPTFATPEEGLASLNLIQIPDQYQPVMEKGKYANIKISYKRAERKIPLEARHLFAAKIQSLEYWNVVPVWTEMEILCGCVHENIVDIHGFFAVDENMGLVRGAAAAGPSTSSQQPGAAAAYHPRNEMRDFYLMLEYATAGNLRDEIKRFRKIEGREEAGIPESGAIYYMKQIGAGVEYLHQKLIAHCDLHPGNIFMKYAPDGTKICLIGDFGIAHIYKETSKEFSLLSGDCIKLSLVVAQMLDKDQRRQSLEARDVIQSRKLDGMTITLFMSYPWFRMEAVPPIPKTPTPLLPDEAVEDMGYLPSVEHPGRRRTESQPQPPPPSFTQRMAHTVRSIPSLVLGRARGTSSTEATTGATGSTRHQSGVETSHTGSGHRSLSHGLRERARSFGQTVSRPFRRNPRR
jgi:serine/threonine protein kinase